MSWSEFLLVAHIVAAIIWLGANFMLTLLFFGLERANDRRRKLELNEHINWLTPRLFIPASISVVVLGILLVADEEFWTFDQLWIVIGLAGWAVSFVLGFFYFRPKGERIAELVDGGRSDDPEIDGIIHRILSVSRVETLILFLVVFDMVLKPTGDDEGMLIVGGLLVAAAVVAAALRIGRGPIAAERAPA